MVFYEDASRIRKGNAPAIMTAIWHLCLNLFEREPSSLRLAQRSDAELLGMMTTALRFCSASILYSLALATSLQATLKRFVYLYNHYIPQKNLYHKTPLQTLQIGYAQ